MRNKKFAKDSIIASIYLIFDNYYYKIFPNHAILKYFAINYCDILIQISALACSNAYK